MADIVELTREALTRWDAGERDPTTFPLHPDFELVSPMSILNGEPFRGLEGFEAWLTEVDTVWEERHIDTQEFRLIGDRVLVLGSFRLRGAGSQALFEQPMGWVFRFDGGLIHRMRLYLDHAEATAAAESSSGG
jgi:ketosteroid isomerase-like protein